jgi:hypothetical protein
MFCGEPLYPRARREPQLQEICCVFEPSAVVPIKTAMSARSPPRGGLDFFLIDFESRLVPCRGFS